MYNVKKINAISPVYHGILPNGEYNVNADVENPDAILVRSANLHDMPINDNLLCVARAGAGVNNIPLDKMAEHGVQLPRGQRQRRQGAGAGGPSAGLPEDFRRHRVVQDA